jgi:hypothetical protein
MFEKCRVQPNAEARGPMSGSVKTGSTAAPAYGSSETPDVNVALAAALLTVEGLSKSSPNISLGSTRRAKART